MAEAKDVGDNEFDDGNFLSCCPPREKFHDATLLNRLLMASVAVILLWCSSLNIAMSLVAKAIPTPRAESVYSTCSYAYEVASVERESYRFVLVVPIPFQVHTALRLESFLITRLLPTCFAQTQIVSQSLRGPPTGCMQKAL